MAVAHSIAAYHILKDDVPLPRPRPDYFTRRADPERLAQRLVAQLEPLGHTVTLQTATSTAEAVAAPRVDRCGHGRGARSYDNPSVTTSPRASPATHGARNSCGEWFRRARAYVAEVFGERAEQPNTKNGRATT